MLLEWSVVSKTSPWSARQDAAGIGIKSRRTLWYSVRRSVLESKFHMYIYFLLACEYGAAPLSKDIMSSSPERSASAKKRKREIIPEDEEDKLEIDVNAPEPASKKAKRKEKKSKSKSKEDVVVNKDEIGQEKEKTSAQDEVNTKPAPAATEKPAKRSDHGIWIGNLPFHATKNAVRDFLRDEGGIDETSVTRVHMPTGEKGQNKGFAYVDFNMPAILDVALTLSERLLLGRKVLIKNAKSFEGRPQKTAAENGKNGNVSEKEPSKRIFVGNLSFDITQDDLEQHFAQAGQIDGVHVATFEDSGKCKGFAWVTFADVDSAKSAVRGFVFKEPEDDGDESQEEGEDGTKKRAPKPKKARKWFINRLYGRELRCEFAEDSHTRYKKRFGRAPKSDGDAVAESGDASFNDVREARDAAPKSQRKPKLDKDQRQEERRKKFDARKTAPGKALAYTQRASEAIVAGSGNKVTFD